MDVYEAADRMLRGFRAHYGEEWTGELSRSIFNSLCTLTSIGKDERTHQKYWELFVSVGWLKDLNGRSGKWNFDVHKTHVEVFAPNRCNGGKQ